MSGWNLDAVIPGRPGLVVHVGAGETGPGPLADAARQVVLVEPDPVRAQRLRELNEGSDRVRIVEAAVVMAAGPVSFYRFSHGAMNSTRQPTGARELFRGLAQVDQVTVHGLTPDKLFEDALLEGEGENVLIIDAASEVLIVLEALQAAGRLEGFDHIIAQVSEASLHQGGAERAAVQDWARAQGRLMLAAPGQTDPDLWRAWIGPSRRPAQARSTGQSPQLVKSLEELRVSAEQAERRHLQAREQLASDLEAARTRIAGLERDLADILAARDEAESKLRLTGEQMAQLEAVAAERQNNEQVRQTLERQHQAAQSRCLELERTLEECERRLRQFAAHHGKLEAAGSEAAERENALKDEVKAARENLRLALTGQRLAQASLSELQARHAALMDDRNALDALLRQVTDRLSNAAGYSVSARLSEDHASGSGDW